MKWVYQPDEEKICGQVAVAAITEAPLEDICAYIGHKHGTKTKELIACLRAFGYECPDRCRASKTPPDMGLAKVCAPDWNGWHWVAVERVAGSFNDPNADTHWLKIYDGAFGTSVGLAFWPDNWRITSYLPVYEVVAAWV